MRNRLQDGMSYFMRAILGRIPNFDSYLSLYQAAIIETNVKYVWYIIDIFHVQIIS